MKRTRLLKSTAGFSMIEAIIAMGLLAAGCLMISTFTSTAFKAGVQTNRDVSLAVARGFLLGHLIRDDSFHNTMTNASNNFSCLGASAGCAGPIIAVNDSSNVVVFNGGGISPANGFTDAGLPCSGFPSATCPVGVTMAWKEGAFGCTNCSSPLFEVDVTFAEADTTDPTTQKPAPEKYNIFLLKSLGP